MRSFLVALLGMTAGALVGYVLAPAHRSPPDAPSSHPTGPVEPSASRPTLQGRGAEELWDLRAENDRLVARVAELEKKIRSAEEAGAGVPADRMSAVVAASDALARAESELRPEDLRVPFPGDRPGNEKFLVGWAHPGAVIHKLREDDAASYIAWLTRSGTSRVLKGIAMPLTDTTKDVIRQKIGDFVRRETEAMLRDRQSWETLPPAAQDRRVRDFISSLFHRTNDLRREIRSLVTREYPEAKYMTIEGPF